MLIVCPNCASEYRLEAAQIGPGGRRVRCSSCQTDWFATPEDAASAQTGRETRDPVEDALDAQWREAALSDPDVAAALAAHDSHSAATADADIAASESASESTTESATGGDEASPAGETDMAEAQDPAGGATPRKAARAEKGDRGQGRKAGRRLSLPAMPARKPSRAGLAAAIGLVALGLGLWRREAITRHVPALAGPLAMIGLPVNIRGAEFENVASELVNDPSGRFLIVQSQIRNITSRPIPVAPVEIVVRDATAKAIYTWAAEPTKLLLQPGETMAFRTRLAQPPQEAHDVQLRFQRGSAQMAQAAK
jgi:predicted Zn finger-like uncharacterized protein